MCARAPNGLRTFLELRHSEPGTPKRGCSYRRVLCARPAGKAERGLSGSDSDSLACHSPFKPRDHILGGLGLHPREHTAVGGDEQIVPRTIRESDGACAIRIDGIRAGEFDLPGYVAAIVS